MSDTGIDQNTARSGSFRSGAATHAGAANRLNEDAFVNRPDLGLWAGAVGHESGEVASAERPASMVCCRPSTRASPPPRCSSR
jgi:hypothetical protein